MGPSISTTAPQEANLRIAVAALLVVLACRARRAFVPFFRSDARIAGPHTQLRFWPTMQLTRTKHAPELGERPS
jgi:hypothetical protein